MLGSEAIREAIADGRIFIDDFNEEHLGPNSYDVTLGEWYVRQRPGVLGVDFSKMDRIDPYSMWDPPQRASNGTIYLAPNAFILAHTRETIGCFEDIVGEMASRSSYMRSGITVCIDAGLGDVGYVGKWTMEIKNNLDSGIYLPVGARVGQMKFHRVEGVGKTYSSKGGTYGTGISEGMWSPDDMLPRSRVM